MSLTRWLSERLGLSGIRELASRPAPPRKRPTFRPRLEALEERYLLSTLTVLNTNDSGAGSLRADIAAAHNGDTIVFAPSLDGQTITLTSGELLIRKNLTIAGPGASQLTISGNNASRVFEVAKQENVTLSSLTISSGAAPSGYLGGGILNYGTLTVSNSTLSGNTALEGGGIFNYGTLTVSGSTLSYNTSEGEGGGIDSQGTLTVSGSSLFYNTSTTEGGGIGNHGTLTVSGSTLSDNSASKGGGIFNAGALTVSGSTLSGNSAASAGGGIYNTNNVSATVTVKNSSSITGNTAPVGFGADVFNNGVLYLDSTSIIGILDGNPAIRI
jgi:predicted outer membrane repeat protein